MRLVTLMGQVSSLVAEKFRTGGGLSYADYPDFHRSWPRTAPPSTMRR